MATAFVSPLNGVVVEGPQVEAGKQPHMLTGQQLGELRGDQLAERLQEPPPAAVLDLVDRDRVAAEPVARPDRRDPDHVSPVADTRDPRISAHPVVDQNHSATVRAERPRG
jgi:hypothetical protein